MNDIREHIYSGLAKPNNTQGENKMDANYNWMQSKKPKYTYHTIAFSFES